jgi:hypothetical protein
MYSGRFAHRFMGDYRFGWLGNDKLSAFGERILIGQVIRLNDILNCNVVLAGDRGEVVAGLYGVDLRSLRGRDASRKHGACGGKTILGPADSVKCQRSDPS